MEGTVDTLPVSKELLRKAGHLSDTISMEMIVSWSDMEKAKGLAGGPGKANIKIRRLPWIAALKILIEVI